MDIALAMVDLDNSGELTFNEFVLTCITPEKMLTKDNIYEAFKDFDADGGGSISIEEIKQVLSPKNRPISEDIWEDAFRGFDSIKEGGEITFVEFKLFLETIF